MKGLELGLPALKRGPVEQSLRFENPAAELGELPLPFRDVRVDVRVEREAEGAARAVGSATAEVEVSCRRCLAKTAVVVRADFDALFRPPDRVTPGEEGVWAIDPSTGSIDLAAPIREELWVSSPEYVECREDCPGLCPRCGARRADEECTCPPPEPDPRWAALKGLDG